MKILWPFLIVFSVGLSAFGAAISGTIPLSAPIAPTDTADTYPSHLALYGKGGVRTVADTTARDAIPSARREEGMIVYVQSPALTAYRLGSDLTTWTEVKIPSASEWSDLDTLEANSPLARRISNEAIPLTLQASSPRTTIGFTRSSVAPDPWLGIVADTNSMRSMPLAWGASLGAAVLVERGGTNIPIVGVAQPLLFATRMTTSDATVEGPYGITVQVKAVTDTADVNTHSYFYELGTNTVSSPVSFSIVFKPAISTNLTYALRFGSATNLGWYVQSTASLTGAVPTVTHTTVGPITRHDSGFASLGNGWWRAWVVGTATNTVGIRASLAPAGFATYAGDTSRPQFYAYGYAYSATPTTNETPIVSLNLTNMNLITSKSADVYRYTNSAPWKASAGSLLFWLRNGTAQPEFATLLESAPSAGMLVGMSRSQLWVSAKTVSGGPVGLTNTVPALNPFGDRQVTVTWSTANGIKAYVDGSLIGSSGALPSALLLDGAGQIGSSVGGSNYWNGFIGAAYYPREVASTEALFVPNVVGPPNP